MKINDKCRWCGKSGELKYYIIADDLENPKPYHEECYKEFSKECLLRYYELFNEEGKCLDKL